MSSPIEFLHGLLAKHFEELEFLLSQRSGALRSTAYQLENLYDLEERIDAHLDGLILGGDEALPLLTQAIEGDEPGPVQAAALTLLWLQQPAAAKLVVDALATAGGPKAQAIGAALCHGPAEMVIERLQELARQGNPAPAAAALEALAYHRQLKPNDPRLAELAGDEDPQIRAATWRVAAML